MFLHIDLPVATGDFCPQSLDRFSNVEEIVSLKAADDHEEEDWVKEIRFKYGLGEPTIDLLKGRNVGGGDPVHNPVRCL